MANIDTTTVQPAFGNYAVLAHEGYDVSLIHGGSGWQGSVAAFVTGVVAHVVDQGAEHVLPVLVFYRDPSNGREMRAEGQLDGEVRGMTLRLVGGVEIDLDDIISFHI